MVEAPFATLALEHPVLIPELGELGAVLPQVGNERADLGIIEVAAAGGAELGSDPARSYCPVGDQ